MTLIDFTLSNARRFYSSVGNPLDGKGLIIRRKSIKLMHRPQTLQPGFGSDYTLLQKFHPSFQNPGSAPEFIRAQRETGVT